MSRKEKMLLFILAALNFTHILDFMIMMPLGNYLMPAFGIGAGAFAAGVAAYNYAAFVTGVLASFWVDRHDRKKVLVFGYTGFLVGTLFCAVAPSFTWLVVARVVAGLFGGLIGAQVMSIVADTFPYEKRGRAMGWLMTAFSFASVIGVPFSLYLARFFSWHAPFFFIVLSGAVVLPAVIRFVPSLAGHLESGRPAVNIAQTLRNIFSVPRQRAALLLSGVIMLGHFMIVPFINPYLEFNMGFSRELTPLIYMAGGATTLVSSMIWGRLADRHGKLWVFTLAGSLSIIPILLITQLPAIPFVVVLIPFAFWFGMSNGRTIATQAMISQVVSTPLRGSFMSINSSMQQLFAGLGSTLAGFIVVSDASHRLSHYEWVGYCSAAIIAVCLGLARRLGVR